jgi:hypothetical protein
MQTSTSETYLDREQVQRVVALREAATLGRDATDTVLFATFILTGSDVMPGQEVG